jgi:tol-pal system protein YbgF
MRGYNMHSNFRLLAIILMFGTGPSFAEGLESSSELSVPIIDISTEDSGDSGLADEIASIKQQVQVLQQQNILSKIKELQSEIQSLRGALDMQEHNFAEIKETMRMKAAPVSPQTREEANNNNNAEFKDSDRVLDKAPVRAPTKDLSSNSEIENYNNAFAILKERDYEGAIKAFSNFLVQFPGGKYSPNANYWLGEIYLLKGEYKNAELSFKTIIEQHSNHGKAPDAIFKLAMVYVNTNEIEKAKELVNKLETSYPNTTAYRMAKIQLRNI